MHELFLNWAQYEFRYKKHDDDDEIEVDVNMSVDTFKTLPPPVTPKIQPLPTYVNLQTMKNKLSLLYIWSQNQEGLNKAF